MGKHTGPRRTPRQAPECWRTDLQLGLDAATTAALILDSGLNTVCVNQTFLDIWNMTPRQARTGTPLPALMNIHRRRQVHDISDEEWEGHVEPHLDEIRKGDVAPREILLRDGRIIICSATSLSGGKRLLSWRDVTEARRHEKALEEMRRSAALADQARSDFLTRISHAIRAPLNGVLGMAELLDQSELDPRQKTFVEIIAKSGNALLTIINDILDSYRIEAGQIVLEPVPFSLAEALSDVAARFGPRAEEKNLELILRVQPGLHDRYIGDAGRFGQMLGNLVANAIQFTDRGHVLVDIGGDEDDEDTLLHVAVTDTGIGIPADRLDGIFDRFSQVSSPSTHRHEGAGLGLAITSGLAKLMNGRISVESREGHGSTFRFTICLPRAASLHKPQTVPEQMSGARILVVDDNAVSRSVVMEQLANWGFDACAARCGEEGLDVLNAMAGLGVHPDCLILDSQMPGMSGAEMTRIVRSSPLTGQLPIILLTSAEWPWGPPGYRDLAIDQFLVKPVCPASLLETLIATIGKNRNEATPEKAATRQGRNPAQDRHIAPNHKADSRGANGGGRQVDVLVAEDNEINQLVFDQILSATGLTYEIVGDGELVVEACRTMKPRLVLMDICMPRMDGLEATAWIRKAEAAGRRRIPIIGVVADRSGHDEKRCLQAGMDDYLSKPVSPHKLAQKIEHWLGEIPARSLSAG